MNHAQLRYLAESAERYTTTELHDATTWYQSRGYGAAAAILRLEAVLRLEVEGRHHG